jgi:thiopurine S-methyltransferase
MENSYWLDKWQKNDIAFHEQDINADLIAYIHELNLKPGDYIFVPLCGKTKDMFWLAEKGFNVIGIELSPIACSVFFAELNIKPHVTKQSKFTKYQNNNIVLFCGDLFNLISSDLPIIHAVYDCKALIALSSDLRKKYIDHIVKCLGKKITILLFTRETSCQVKPPPFPISKAEVDLLYGSYFDVRLLKNLSITDIPDRLVNKGYAEMTESVYLISGKDTVVK